MFRITKDPSIGSCIQCLAKITVMVLFRPLMWTQSVLWQHILDGLDWAGPGQIQVADACECGNEPSGSVKCGEFLDQLQTSQLLKKDCAPQSKYVSKYCIQSRSHRVSGEGEEASCILGQIQYCLNTKQYKHGTFISSSLIIITIIFVIISAIFIFSITSKPSLGHKQRPIQRVLAPHSPGVKGQDSDTQLLVPRL